VYRDAALGASSALEASMSVTLEDLGSEDRLRLMRFVCTFAWADLEIQDAEQSFVRKLIDQLDFDEEETAQIEGYLKTPPKPEEVDPNDVPVEHRQVFLNLCLQLVGADGVVAEAEMETLSLLEKLLRPESDID
jgi:uncharacterized tellurite resistance protein B-like protein